MEEQIGSRLCGEAGYGETPEYDEVDGGMCLERRVVTMLGKRLLEMLGLRVYQSLILKIHNATMCRLKIAIVQSIVDHMFFYSFVSMWKQKSQLRAKKL